MNAIDLSAERANPKIGIPRRCRDPAWPGAHERYLLSSLGGKLRSWSLVLG